MYQGFQKDIAPSRGSEGNPIHQREVSNLHNTINQIKLCDNALLLFRKLKKQTVFGKNVHKP